jgi:hypothetical protein
MSTTEQISLIESDLKKSGLEIQDMRARFLESPERASCNIPPAIEGYVIPYFDLHGQPIPYFRAKLFDYKPKYKQVKNSPNHVYFPLNFLASFVALPKDGKYIVITEGEKKAACACKIGIPTIAFGGVDSWQNKLITIPGDAEITSNQLSGDRKTLNIRVPDNAHDRESFDASPLARGFQELLDFAMTFKATFIITYDSDRAIGVKPEVQRAASRLAYELRFRGFKIHQIRQLVLPPIEGLDKSSIDDYITYIPQGSVAFHNLIKVVMEKRKAFPRNPNVREFVNKKLQNTRLTRKDMQALSLAVISELDAKGQRMFSVDAGQMYYFDNDVNKLMKAPVNIATREQLQETIFGKLLYNDFGISPSADARLMQWIGAQFAAEDPIDNVTPHRVFARDKFEDDFVNYQINDSQFVKVSKDGLEVFDNGSEGILFESEVVSPLDASELLAEYERISKLWHNKPVPNQWAEVLREVRLKDHGNSAILNSLLYYISPWLFRWRGTQLPVELIIGESGSGKSTLMELRLDILTGIATLRNAPQDLKDWHASVVNTGGLHVTDNVQLIDKQMQQRLSDEICRLITEPDPHVEMRKYYTNTDLIQIPVNAVFAFTAIKQPFINADLLQRAIILDFDKAPSSFLQAQTQTQANINGFDLGQSQITYDSRWRFRQLEKFGGRIGWMAHHLYVLERFFKAADTMWSTTYRATHRLINLEQILMIVGQSVFGIDTSWIPQHLVTTTNAHVTEADWAFEGIRAYVEAASTPYKRIVDIPEFTAADIASWASTEDDYKECIQLVNARRLGRYMQMHKHMIASVAGIHEARKYANRQMYIIRSTKATQPTSQ